MPNVCQSLKTSQNCSHSHLDNAIMIFQKTREKNVKLGCSENDLFRDGLLKIVIPAKFGKNSGNEFNENFHHCDWNPCQW